MNSNLSSGEAKAGINQSGAAGLRQKLVSVTRLFSGQGAREGYLAAVDQGVISLSNFVATIILARNITPTELGMYGVGFTALRLVRSIQEGLTIQPLNTYGAAMNEQDFKRYASSTSLIQIGLAMITSAGAAGLGLILIRLGNDVAGPTIFSLWFAFLWWQLQEYVRRICYTRGEILTAVINSILANGFRIGLLIWWVSSGQLNGLKGLDAIAWGSLIALVLGIWQTRAFWSVHFANLPQTWEKNWDFGRWVMGGTIANWVSTEFYPVLTAGMISFAAAGAYRVIQNLVAPVQLLLRAIDTFLTPRAARLYAEKGQPALQKLLRMTYLITGIPIVGILAVAIIFPSQLLRLLYKDTYVAYSNAVVLMAAFYILWFAYWPLQTAFKAIRSTRPIFVANLAAMIAMFTVGIWMIWQWGVYGTVAGQALNALILTLIHWHFWISGKDQQALLSQ